jgi:hypothetical protein
MKVRDIIAAVPAKRWRIWLNPMRDDGVFVGEDCPAFVYDSGQKAAYPDGWSLGCQMKHEYADFIAAFDPEHVALMEAVIEACLWPGDKTFIDYVSALDSLEAYRTERAL